MSIIKKFGAIALFLVVIFVVIEMSFRFYVVGPLALNPWRSNSMNTLMRSEYVQLSQYPDLFFELKPNMKGWFKGVRFATNSAGMAGNEYPREKPQDVFRIAVAGSSWTMASGVEQDQAWPAVLERRLNGQKKFEVLNFAVELYGLRELVATVRHKTMDWSPDLVVVAVTTFTSFILWEEPHANQVLSDRAYPVFVSYALRALAGRFGWSVDSPAYDRLGLGSDEGGLMRGQLQRTMRELGELKDANNVPIVIMFLGYVPLGSDMEDALSHQAAQLGLTVVFANQIFPVERKQRSKLQISPYDRHPNAAGQELIAGFIAEELARRRLLPE